MAKFVKVLPALSALLATDRVAWAQDTSQALDEVSWKTNNAKVNGLVSFLTAEEKISLVHQTFYAGSQDFAGYINAIPRLRIPAIQMADGEAGINGVLNTTAIPSQLNIASSFDLSLAYLGGLVTGRDARLLNASIALAPRVNILRDPFEMSAFQGYSEDPYLNGQMGTQGVRGIQDQGTMANSKQIGPSSYGASGGDDNAEIDLQVLHEVYWAPHEELVKAGAATLMCQYTAINGVQACQYDELLNLTLRGDWNFTGAVMSDWGAASSTTESIIAGLDWEMGSNLYYTDALYDDIYVHKNLSESYLNRAVHRILTLYDQFGILDGHGSQGTSTAVLLTAQDLPQAVADDDDDIAYYMAVRTGALLKNEGDVLPLDKSATIAVLGATGLQLTNGAGFAERSYGFDERKVAPLNALKNASSSLKVSSAVGVDMHGTVIPSSNLRTPNGQRGLLRNDSVSSATTVDSTVNFSNANGNALPADTTYTWTGHLLANTTGYYRIALQRHFPHFGGAVNATAYLSLFSDMSMSINGTTFSGFRIYLDGGVHPLSSPLPTNDLWDEDGADVYLEAGAHNLTITAPAVFDDPVEIRLSWVTPEQRRINIDEAVKLANQVDTPVVFAHANSLPAVGMQLIQGFDDLISAVAAANPKTVVVLHNTDPVLMPWLDSVAGVLWMGMPGQEGGRAIADLLLGNRSPGGRLPITYPASVNSSMTRNPDYPNRVDAENGTAVFSEGLNVGYRWYVHSNTSVLFPFGYGLSYTTFKYGDLAVTNTSATDFEVEFSIRNTGSKTGAAVPQLYLGPPSGASRSYPGIQFASEALVGFDSIELSPGGFRRVTLPISQRQLSFWNQTDRSWVLAKGTRKVWVGTDALTAVLVGQVTV